MEKTKITEYRSGLSDERIRLVKSLNRSNRVPSTEFKVEHTEDEGDLAIISHNRGLLYNLDGTDLARLKAIEDALHRIDAWYLRRMRQLRRGNQREAGSRPSRGLPYASGARKISKRRASYRYVLASADPEPPEM